MREEAGMSCVELDDVEAEDDFEDLDDPVAWKQDDEANDCPGDSLFAFGLTFWVGGVGEHGEATTDEHNKEEDSA